MVDQFGVHPRMKKWILWCVKTITIFFMVNGCRTEPFKLDKGLRQGDPISSFMLTMVSESLTFVIKLARSLNVINGVQITSDRVVLTHLQFGDHTLLFIPKDK